MRPDLSWRLSGAAVAVALVVSTGPAFTECANQLVKSAKVVQVIDAHTIEVDDGTIVRLIGALLPKTLGWWDDRKPWPSSQTATRALAQLADGRRVELAVDHEGKCRGDLVPPNWMFAHEKTRCGGRTGSYF